MALNFKSYQFTSTGSQGVNAINVTTTSVLVRLVKFHNGNASAVDVEVKLTKSGGTGKTIIKKQLATGENFDALVDMLAIETGDVLRIEFGGSGVSVLISYVENTTSFEGHSVVELTDWSNTAPTNGQIPVWDAASGEYVPTTSGSTISNTDDLSEGTTNLYFTNARTDARIAAASVDDLSDVDTTTVAPTTGQALVWDGTQWEPGTVSGGGGGATDLDGLSDVSAASPSNGDVIVYNTGTSTWTTSASLQNLVALLKQPTADTTTIEADTSNKITIDKTTAAEKVVATVDGTDAMVVKDTHTEFKGVLVENQGRLTLRELSANGTNYIALQSPSSVTTTTTFVLPDGDGTSGQFLKTDGSANLSWGTASGGGGGTNQMMIPWAFFDSTIRDVFIPITSELENTSSQRYNKFVAPFAGSLTSCTIFGTLNQSGGTGVTLTISKQTGTNVYTDQESVTLSSLTAYATSTFTFSTNSFSAGDVLMFELTNGFSTAFGNKTGTLLFTAS